jgi:primosomal protein N'
MAIKAVHTIKPLEVLCNHDDPEVAEHDTWVEITCRHCLGTLRVEKRCPDCNAPVITRVED